MKTDRRLEQVKILSASYKLRRNKMRFLIGLAAIHYVFGPDLSREIETAEWLVTAFGIGLCVYQDLKEIFRK